MERRLRCFAVAAGAVAAAIGAVYLLAWLSGSMTYRGSSSLTIKTNTSLCLILCGTALMQAVPADPSPLLRWTARCFAIICLMVGGLTVVEYLSGWDLAIDQLLAVEAPGALGVVNPNRMGPPAAVSFTLGGIAILFLLHAPRPLVRQSQWIGIIQCLIALQGLLAFIYGTRALPGVSSYTSIAGPTAIAIALLGAGLLCARPKEGLMVSITSADAGGVAIRRLLAAAILVPIALGWLHLQGESHRLYDRISGTSFLVITWILIFSWLVHQTAKRLCRADEAKRSALTALQRTQALLLEAEKLSHTGAWEWDLNSDIWTFSDEWQRLHGTRDRSLRPDELISIAHPEDRPAIQEAFDALNRGASPYEMEHRIVRQDTGEVRTVRASGQYLRDKSGRW